MKSFTLGPLSLLFFTLQKSKTKKALSVSHQWMCLYPLTKPAACAYIVVSSRPAWVQLGVDESLLASHLVIFGLFFFGQRVPLRRGKIIVSGARESSECVSVIRHQRLIQVFSIVSADERTHPLAQYLVDGSALFHFALSHHFGPLVSHVQHEGVERLLDVGLPLFLLLLMGVGCRFAAKRLAR